MPECAHYERGDLVTLKGIPPVAKPKPMVVRDCIVSEWGGVSYEVRLLEDDLSNYRKGYSLTTQVSDSSIMEGKCRGTDTRKWALPPEKASAYERMIRRPAPAPPAVAPVPDFDRFKTVVDSLLGELPEKTVKDFARTPEMALYTKVVKGGETPEEGRRFVEVVDTLLGELPQKTVEGFIKTPDYEVYRRVIAAVKK